MKYQDKIDKVMKTCINKHHLKSLINKDLKNKYLKNKYSKNKYSKNEHAKNKVLNKKFLNINSICEEDGVLTIEAALVLSAYLLVFISLSLFIYLLSIQSATHFALDQTALYIGDQIEFKEYMYKNAETVGDFFAKNADKDSVIISRKDLDKFSDVEIVAKLKEKIDSEYCKRTFYSFLPLGGSIIKNRMLCSDISVRMDDNGPIIMELNYQLELPGVFRVGKKMNISQVAATGVWAEKYNFEIKGNGNSDEDEEENEDNKIGIWQKSPFERGKIFVNSIRNSADDMAVKPGQGFDIYNKPNSLYEVVSLNIFSKSYSDGDGKNSASYKLKRENLKLKFSNYAKKEINNFRKYRKLTLENGEVVNVPDGVNLGLYIVVPEEAKMFDSEFKQICDEVIKDTGVSINIRYIEKAF